MATVHYSAFISYSHALDGRLAPALDDALERFAKPWYRRRALHVFRDETSLSANPGLWPSIEAALASSEFFILLASPEAAQSQWVNREVEYWCEHKPRETLLIALTAGTLVWDPAAGDFDWTRTTALPRALEGRLSDEPRHIDLTWTRTEEHLSLRHTLFRDRVADLAAPLHHRPKDDLVGEDIRQHRRTRRLVAVTTSALVLLTAAAVVSAIRAGNSAEEARAQRDRAEAQARVATARYVAARAVNEGSTVYERSLLLSLASLAIAPTSEGRASLLENLQRNRRLQAFWKPAGPDPAHTVAWSPDGKLVATGEPNDRVTVWDAHSGAERCRLFRPHGNYAMEPGYVAISRKGLLAAATQDGQIRFADARRCRERGQTRRNPWDTTGPVAFSSDGKTLASGGVFGFVTLWSVKTRKPIRRLRAGRDEEAVVSIAFSPDGRRVAAGHGDGRLMFYDTRQGALVAPLEAHEGAVNAVAFSPNDGHLLSGGVDGRVLRWDSVSSSPQAVVETAGMVNGLSFDSAGRRAAAAGFDGTIRVWKPRGGGPPLTLRGHSDAVDDVGVSPDGRRLVSAAEDGTVALWDLGAGPRLARVSAGAKRVTALAVSPTGDQIALGTGNRVVLRDARRRTERKLRGLYGVLSALQFDREGQTLAAATRQGLVGIWSADARRVIRRPQRVHREEVTGLAFGRGGALLASSSRDGRVAVMSRGTGELRWSDQALGPPDRGYEADNDLEDVAVSPDGSIVATVGFTQIHTFDTSTGVGSGVIDAQAGALFDVAFRQDGRTVAAGALGSVELRDLETDQRVGGELRSSDRAVGEVGFAPGGQTVVAIREDGSTVLWDLRGTQLGRPLPGAEDWTVAELSPAGDEVVQATADGRLIRWRLDLRTWIRETCRLVGRDLERDEWRRLVGNGIDYSSVCRRRPARR